MAKPTAAETGRLMRELLGAGTVRRLDLLHQALVQAYQAGAADTERRMQAQEAS